MRLLLARHGNTFESNQTPVLIGAGQDLPLVARGFEQARILAQHLRRENLVPSLVLSAELLRTKQFAEEILRTLGEGSIVYRSDARLNEIDYGRWTGRSGAELAQGQDAADWSLWDQHSAWPANANFGSSLDKVLSELNSLVQELRAEFNSDATVLCVSSNGTLRYFLSFIPGEMQRRFESGDFKMATGALSLLENAGQGFKLSFWNQTPSAN